MYKSIRRTGQRKHIQSGDNKEALEQIAQEQGGLYYLCDPQDRAVSFIIADDYDKSCHTGSCSSYSEEDAKIFKYSALASNFPDTVQNLCKNYYPEGRYTLYRVSKVGAKVELDPPKSVNAPRTLTFEDPYSGKFSCIVDTASDFNQLDGACLKLM